MAKKTTETKKKIRGIQKKTQGAQKQIQKVQKEAPKKKSPLFKIKLHNLHLLAALLYIGQLAAMVSLFIYGDLAIAESVWPLDITFLSENLLTGSEESATRHIYDLKPIYVLPVIAFLAGLPFLVAAWRVQFYREVVFKRQINVLRWLIAGLVFGLVIFSTAAVLGITNLGYLLLLFASMLAFAWLALMIEFLRSEVLPLQTEGKISKDKLVLAVASFNIVAKLQALVVIVPWAVLFLSLAAAKILSSQMAIGWMHYLVFISAFMPIVLWHFGSLARWRSFKRWQNYVFVEKFYFVTQFVFLSGWLWLIIYGNF